MPYDSSLDKSLFSKSTESEMGNIIVSVYSYNGGQKKLQITRENKDKQGNLRFAKLGRMNREEVESILPLIQEALGQMD